MKRLNVFDFDNTLYDGDSSINFYLYCLRKHISIARYIPIQLYGAFLYLLKIRSKEYFKEKYFSFLKGLKNVDKDIEEFWNKEEKNIKIDLMKDKNNIVIISASPEFLLEPISKKLKIEKLIATRVNKKNGKFMSKNCHDKEKVKRLNEEYSNYIINEFYTDSQSDRYIAEISEKSFLVKKDKIFKYNITESTS